MKYDSTKVYQVEELEYSKSNLRTYQLVEVRILKAVGKKKRKQIINKIIEDRNAIGSIEWWARGSIVNKPMFTFKLILIF
ncbi:MAG: hypothetical protein ACQCN4_11825 [Candidatus Bathyarchaeia archaeon]|jgi:hypothetical protein